MLIYRFLIVGFCVLAATPRIWAEDDPGDRKYGESSVAFAPDSTWVATGGGDAKVRIRDIPDGRLRATLVGHEKLVTAVAVSPDGKTIVSGSNDGSIRLWDVETLKERHVWRVPESRSLWGVGLAYSPDGQTIAVSSEDGRLRLWDVAGGKVKASWNASLQWVDVVVFAPDGRTIATTGHDNIVRLWDVPTRALRFELAPFEKSVVRLAYSRDGSLLAVSNSDLILLLDAKTGKEWSRLADCPIGIRGLAFTKDDAYLVAGGNWKVCLISTGIVVDVGVPSVLEELPIALSHLAGIAISPNGELLALSFLSRRDTGHASFQILSLRPLSRRLELNRVERN